MSGSLQKEVKVNVKTCIYKSKKEVNEQFRRKMNHDVSGKRKLFWREVTKVNGGKVKRCSKIKDGNRRLVLGVEELQKI